MGMTPSGVYQLSGQEPRLASMAGGQQNPMGDARRKAMMMGMAQGAMRPMQAMAQPQAPLPQEPMPNALNMMVNPVAQADQLAQRPGMPGQALNRILG
jgi:hypothetical protein